MSFEIGQAVAILTKSAKRMGAAPVLSYGLSGKLQYTKSGWLLLQVPNAIVRGAFDALDEPGIELPLNDDGRLEAHVSVMRPEEIEQIGGADKITERGHSFSYTLGPVRSVVPGGWKEMSRVWMIEVRSPALKKLRVSYGLTPLPHDNEYQFHVTIAVRRKGVLASNTVAKAASLIHGDGDLTAFFESPLNKEGRRCPSCGELFKEIEPYPDVENCETCERFGPPKEATTNAHVPPLPRFELMGSRGRATMYGRPEPEGSDYDYVAFTDNPQEQQALLQHVSRLVKLLGYKQHERPGGFFTISGNNQDFSVYPTSKRDDIHKAWELQEGGASKDDAWAIVNKAAAVSTKQMIATERRKVEEPASEEQAAAGNYRKGHIKLHGLDISIENAKGSTRSGTSPEGKTWSIKMEHDYGYIRTTEGPDGDSVDVFIGGSPDTELVFVVNQLDPKTKKFDEFKCMLGFNTQEEAEEGYLANYEKDWKGMGEVVVLTIPQFKEWLKGDTKKPIKDDLFAKQSALGIPDRADVGDLAKLPPGLVDFVIQYHQARRAGPHFDVRFGTPGTGLFSWATRHALPEPGFRRALFRQPLHSHDYGSFEGNLPVGGYGAGQVKIHRKGQVLVTKIKPGLVEFTTADKRHPERFKLLRPAGWKDDDWLLINTTPRKGLPYDKIHYKKIDGTQVDSAIDKMQQGDSIEAKIDGASSLVKLLEKGVEITSYRTSKEGRPIVHTERVFHGRPEVANIPKELVGTVLKGELYGQGPEGVIPAQELGGLLNAALGKSIGQQKERGIQLRDMIYDIEQLGSQPIDINQVPRAERRRMMEQVIEHLNGADGLMPEREAQQPDRVFHLSKAVEDPEKARQLWTQIQAGKHPLTSEGIVGHPAVGRPWKGKITEESDVHVTGVFPGEGRLAGEAAGGFEYALEPGGPTVGKVGTGVSDEVRRALWADPEAYIGRIAKIRAQEQFPSGAYRAPVFRSWHEDYPLATKEGEVQGPYCSVDDLQRVLPEANLPLDGGLQKRADKEEHPPIIAVDLDGTILEYDGWKGEDHFGDPRVGARKALKELQRRGYLVVIHTCRGNTQAVKDVLHEHDLPYDYVNFNPHQPPGTSDKIQADIYIDDRAVNARQPWSKITKETLRRIEAANKAHGNGKTKAANQGSFYLAAIPGTQITYDPNESAVRNLVRNLGHVRQRGDQAIREAYTQDALANAADPNRSIRRFSAYLAGTRKPIVHHWLDRIIQGGL